ncbi:MAG: conjugal transfer protein [Burkholderiales bacterium RIFOXYD12_FULL_59_19]|nr:MAG: conjugal transfer protein [Burkholderiales bacterium RIFOXYD12_FULL_59_19]
MASRDDERFRVKPGAPKGRAGQGNGQRSQRFVSQVLKQVSKTGANASGNRRVRPASTFGRGRVAAGKADQTLAVTARRVVIKSRYVVLKKAGVNSVSTHLRYIERDGVTRDGEKGQPYGPETDAADLKAFEARGKGDRHQFRFIVSVEDAGELEDLRDYTREFMQRMSTDLETGLDWVAVDHWDTDNPHTHIVLRGRAGEGRGKGQDLVIAPDYMAHGMRMRASELATEWLGPRTELEIRRGLLREVEQERLTSLDRALMRQVDMGVVDLTQEPKDRQRQTHLRARLQRLEGMELAGRIDANRWKLSPNMEQTLAAMGERGDILLAMHKALKGQQRELVLETELAGPVIGRIAAKGLADELNDRGYLVVDGMDGRAHYVRLPVDTDLTALPVGGIVDVKAVGGERTVDRTIVGIVREGLYRTVDHLVQLRQENTPDPQTAVDVHVRRLEALRRWGAVERVADGVWNVPSDFLLRAQAHDAKKTAGITIDLRSQLSVEQQVRAQGATWLDRQLVGEASVLAQRGFGVQVRDALQERMGFLVEQGLAERRGSRVVLARNLLSTLRDRELTEVGKVIQNETGLIHRLSRDGVRTGGVYRRSVQLASGRFAMLDDGVGFSLVPWRAAMERYLGRSVFAVVRGASVNWGVARERGLSP